MFKEIGAKNPGSLEKVRLASLTAQPAAGGSVDRNIYSAVKRDESVVAVPVAEAKKSSSSPTATESGGLAVQKREVAAAAASGQGKKVSESRIPRRLETAESSPARRQELQEKLARLNSRYVAGIGGSLVTAATTGGGGSVTDPQEAGKVGLAALQDIAARQEAALAALEDVTPTNEQSVLRYDPVSNKMSLAASSSSLPSSPQRLPATRYIGHLLLTPIYVYSVQIMLRAFAITSHRAKTFLTYCSLSIVLNERLNFVLCPISC